MWNAELYNSFEKERIQPSMDLANRIIHDDCKRIIDVGCGSGMSTQCVKSRFPSAEIIGVDLSKSMLEKAQNLIKDVKWIQRDCGKSLEDLGKFDVVFSNAFLQWIDNQEEFIKNTRELLNPDGVFAIQIPNSKEMETGKILKRVSVEFDIDNTLFDNIGPRSFTYTNQEYYNLFSKYYSNVEMWQTTYYHQMKDSDSIVEFIKSTLLMPYLECLNNEQAEIFLSMIKKEAANHYRASENGKVLFPFHRLFLISKV